MYNTSTALIDIQIKKDSNTLRSITVPYDLMTTIENMYWLDSRTVVSTILLKEFTLPAYPNTFQLNPTTGPHQVLTVYETIKSFKEDEESILASLMSSQIYENYSEGNPSVDEEMRLRMRPTEIQYAESLIAQQSLIENHLAELNAQAEQDDLNRMTVVRTIAVDPSRCVEFLLTPVGHTGDVQRQMAASIAGKVEHCTQIVSSTASLWLSSYDLMQEFSKIAYLDKEFAQLFHDQLPEDSVTKANLKRTGLAS
jgi:hypothetical protein